jgi:hypothetical protein
MTVFSTMNYKQGLILGLSVTLGIGLYSSIKEYIGARPSASGPQAVCANIKVLDVAFDMWNDQYNIDPRKYKRGAASAIDFNKDIGLVTCSVAFEMPKSPTAKNAEVLAAYLKNPLVATKVSDYQIVEIVYTYVSTGSDGIVNLRR